MHTTEQPCLITKHCHLNKLPSQQHHPPNKKNPWFSHNLFEKNNNKFTNTNRLHHCAIQASPENHHSKTITYITKYNTTTHISVQILTCISATIHLSALSTSNHHLPTLLGPPLLFRKKWKSDNTITTPFQQAWPHFLKPLQLTCASLILTCAYLLVHHPDLRTYLRVNILHQTLHCQAPPNHPNQQFNKHPLTSPSIHRLQFTTAVYHNLQFNKL